MASMVCEGRGESRREMREFEMEEERREKLTDPVLMEQVFCFPED
jgi:hypothetical protein